jgi:hypothetical protein
LAALRIASFKHRQDAAGVGDYPTMISSEFDEFQMTADTDTPAIVPET